jgi:hypothetical protein
VTGTGGEVEGFARRYWSSLVDDRSSLASPAPRGREGYGFWRRYLASLFGVALPVWRGASDSLALDRTRVRPRRTVLAVRATSDLGRFFLPVPAARGTVAAAGGDEVVLRAAGDNGRVEYLLHRSDAPEPVYRLEIVLRSVEELPVVATVWYDDGFGGPERTLLVPITEARLGPPSSIVRLSAYDPAVPIRSAAPVSPSRVEEWPPDVVHASVEAAADKGTVRAWREVAGLLSAQIRDLILSELE